MAGPGRSSEEEVLYRACKVEEIEECPSKFNKKKKKIFCALVQPHLDYCSVVWQECSLELKLRLDRIQNYGMRLILSQPPRTPSEGLRKVKD